MQRYYDLLKNNVIEFNKILLDKYSEIGLNEVEVIILMKLNNFLLQGEKSVSVFSKLTSKTISEEECSDIVIDLVKKGYVSMEISSTNSKEVFSLDETYQKLSFVLEGLDTLKDDEIRKINVKKTLNDLEKELQISLSALDIQAVNRWYYESSYTYEEISEGIIEALKNKRRGVAFIDRYLYRMHLPKEEVEINPDLENMFKKVYNKNGK